MRGGNRRNNDYLPLRKNGDRQRLGQNDRDIESRSWRTENKDVHPARRSMAPIAAFKLILGVMFGFVSMLFGFESMRVD